MFKDPEYSKMVKDLKVKILDKIISFMTIIARGAWVRSLRGQKQREAKQEQEIQNKIIWARAEGFAAQVVINKGSENF